MNASILTVNTTTKNATLTTALTILQNNPYYYKNATFTTTTAFKILQSLPLHDYYN